MYDVLSYDTYHYPRDLYEPGTQPPQECPTCTGNQRITDRLHQLVILLHHRTRAL